MQTLTLKFPVVYQAAAPHDIVSMISLEVARELLNEAEYGKSQKCVAITFLSCNRDKKTGGEMITIASAQKHGLRNHPGYRHMFGIYDLTTGKRHAVHERLTFKINGQEVFW